MISLLGNALYQWDIDRKIKVYNEDIKKVSFSNKHHCDSCPVEVVNGEAFIPNHLLQSSLDIEIYGIRNDGTLVYSSKLAINSKKKPDDYNIEIEGGVEITQEQIEQIEKNRQDIVKLSGQIASLSDGNEVEY